MEWRHALRGNMWTVVVMVTVIHTATPIPGSVDLMYGTQRTGVVVMLDENWKQQKVCNGGYFDDKAATVVCKLLGFKQGLSLPLRVFGFMNMLDMSEDKDLLGLQCVGNETYLSDCPRNTSATCTDVHGDYASVSCYDEEETKEKYWLDLTNEEGNELAGRVRVFYKQTSGYACQTSSLDENWTDRGADVLCRQLGKKGGAALYFKGDVGGPYFINYDQNCLASVTSLDTCATMGPSFCFSRRAAGVLCYNSVPPITTLTLEGPNRRYGRVTITIDGEEGRVCGHGWTERESKVVCKMLGYTDGVPTSHSRSSKPIFMSGVFCGSRRPSNIFRCDNNGWRRALDSNCIGEDATEAGVFCFDIVRLLIMRTITTDSIYGVVTMNYPLVGLWNNVCSRLGHANAKVMCRDLGFSMASEKDLGIAGNYEEQIRLNCKGDENSTAYCPFWKEQCDSSTLLLCYNANPNEEWDWSIEHGYHGAVVAGYRNDSGYVCPGGWDKRAAGALCRQKGHNGGIVFGSTTELKSNFYHYVLFTCPADAASMTQCHINMTEELFCPSAPTYPAAVLCYNVSAPTVSVVDGRTPDEGRVQIEYDGVKGSVCRGSWSNSDARVLCRQLGYRNGEAMDAPANSSSSGQWYLSNLNCSHTSKSIFECPNDGWNDAGCDQGDAWVSCYMRVELKYGTNRTGVVVTFDENSKPQQVCNGGYFDDKAATVVCKLLGFKQGLSLPLRVFGFMDMLDMSEDKDLLGLQCVGNETFLSDCPRNTSATCTDVYGDYASVSCYDEEETKEKYWLDLTNEEGNQLAGRVRVFYKQTSGYACQKSSPDENWTDRGADVLCRQLGKKGGVALYFKGDVGGPYFINYDRNCSASVTSLDTCATMGPSFCFSGRAAGVLCYNSVPPITTLTLEGPNRRYGRVTITIDGEEGRVCGHGWTERESDVVCKILGYSEGVPTSHSRSSKPIFMSGVFCGSRKPSNIFRCDNNGWRRALDSNCIGEDATEAGVFCFDIVRLLILRTITTDSIYGLVTMNYPPRFLVGQWNSVCSRLGHANAKVMCRELGFSMASEMYLGIAHDYEHPIRLNCKGDENSTAYCPFWKEQCDSLTHLLCYNANPNEEWDWSIEHGYHGAVVAGYRNDSGYVCPGGWDKRAAGALCRQKGHNGGIVFGSSTELKSNFYHYVLFTCPADAASMTQCHINMTEELFCPSAPTYPAAVLCYNVSAPTVSVVDGRTPDEGRVQIEYDGVNGSVCRGNWSNSDARVLCRQLGYTDGEAMDAPANSSSSGQWYLSNLNCSHTSKSIFECPNDGWNDTGCDQGDAWVSCYMTVDLRYSSNGTGVVVTFDENSKPQQLCNGGYFDDKAATVVCKLLGFKKGLSIPLRVIGYKFLPVDQDLLGLQCVGNETYLSDCPRNTSATCTDMKGDYASVSCYGKEQTTDTSTPLPVLPTAQPSGLEDDNTVELAVGITVGLVILIVVVFAVVLLVKRYRICHPKASP